MALRRNDLTPDQRSVLEVVMTGGIPVDGRLFENKHYERVPERFYLLNRAGKTVRRYESRRLGVPLHKPRAYDVILREFFGAARKIEQRPFGAAPSFTVETFWPQSIAMYLEFLSTGVKNQEKYNAYDIADVVKRLQCDGFAAELLRTLWQECPEEAKEMGLPKPRGVTAEEKPAWARLVIHSSKGADDTAELDGKTFRLTGANDARFLETLQEQKGMTLSATSLGDAIDERPDRVYKRLKKSLQRIIEKPGKGRKGYRML
ncbi:MAG: hypothetical protein AABZ47_05685 [Planctomycetota bacterium]